VMEEGSAILDDASMVADEYAGRWWSATTQAADAMVTLSDVASFVGEDIASSFDYSMMTAEEATDFALSNMNDTLNAFGDAAFDNADSATTAFDWFAEQSAESWTLFMDPVTSTFSTLEDIINKANKDLEAMNAKTEREEAKNKERDALKKRRERRKREMNVENRKKEREDLKKAREDGEETGVPMAYTGPELGRGDSRRDVGTIIGGDTSVQAMMNLLDLISKDVHKIRTVADGATGRNLTWNPGMT